MLPDLSILETRVAVTGLANSLRVLHVTDVHLCECDGRDPLQRNYLAQTNEIQGGQALVNFDRLIAALPRLKPDFVAFTGDLMVSPTQANLAALFRRLKHLPVPFGLTFGNHDWDIPERGTQERHSLQRERIRQRYIEETGRNPTFQSFNLGAVQLLLVDNSDYQVRDAQLQQVNHALRRGPPACLFYHVPLSQPALREATVAKWGDPILCCADEWSENRRRVWHAPVKDDASTRTFRDLVAEDSRICGAFSGHVHLDHSESMASGTRQIVSPPLYEGCARMVHFQSA